MRTDRVVACLVMALALLLESTGAFAQTGQNFGELVGHVVDAQGGVLPGVTVTMTGSSVMGTPTAVTNERGDYRFPAVPSGAVSLSFALPGFATVVQENVVVRVRETITVDAQMKVASLQETVTVTGASPIIDVENAKVGGRLDQATLESVPTSRTLFGSATLMEGMVMGRQDPGGLNAASSTGMVAHGAAGYNLNYYGVTADTPQDYGSMYYMDFGSAQEVSVDSAAMGAEVGGGGGANINIIPKTGGNEIKGQAVYSLTGRGYSNIFSGSNITDELREQGVTEPTLQRLNDFNANAGGPFVRDRWWWFGSIRNYNTHENVAGFPIDYLSNLRNYTASTQYQLTTNNKLSGFWTYNKKFVPHRGAAVSNPRPEGTYNQQSVKHLYNANLTSVIGANTFLEVSSSYFHMYWPSVYADEFQGLPDSQRVPASYNISTGIYFDGPYGSGERVRNAYRQQTNVGLTRYIDHVLGANHQLKAGFENWWGWGSDGFDVLGDTRLRYRDVDGVPVASEFYAYNTPLVQRTRMKNFAGFLQDRLTYPRVSINLGLRWSYYHGSIPAQDGGGGRWFPQVAYPEVDAPYSWNTLAPRTSLTWQITEDGRNVAKVAYSRYYEVMYTTEFDSINQNIIRTGGVATYDWFGDLNQNGAIDDGEYDPTPKSVFQPTANTIDPDLRNPRNDEILLGYQRQLAGNLSLGVNWIQRWFNDKTLDVNVGVPTSAYTAATFSDPGPDNLVDTGDDREVTFYNEDEAYLGKDSFLHTNFEGTQRYRGLELQVSKRMSNRWQATASYVWSRLDGDRVLDWTDPNNLVDSMKTGRGDNDQPHSFKLRGSFLAPWDISLGANFQSLSGLPRDRTLNVGLRQGTTGMLVDPRGTWRADVLNLLSLRADKGFSIGGSRQVSVVFEVHNVLNSHAGQSDFGDTTRAFASQAAFDAARLTTSYFGRVQEIVAPRILKIGFKIEF